MNFFFKEYIFWVLFNTYQKYSLFIPDSVMYVLPHRQCQYLPAPTSSAQTIRVRDIYANENNAGARMKTQLRPRFWIIYCVNGGYIHAFPGICILKLCHLFAHKHLRWSSAAPEELGKPKLRLTTTTTTTVIHKQTRHGGAKSYLRAYAPCCFCQRNDTAKIIRNIYNPTCSKICTSLIAYSSINRI